MIHRNIRISTEIAFISPIDIFKKEKKRNEIKLPNKLINPMLK